MRARRYLLLRSSLLVGAIWALAPTLPAQVVLARTRMSVATTCGIQTDAKSVAVQPGKGVVIALLGDTIRPEDWTRLREEVASFYQATRDKETIRVAYSWSCRGAAPTACRAG